MNLRILRTLYIIPTLILYDPRFNKYFIIHPKHYFRKLVFVCRIKNTNIKLDYQDFLQNKSSQSP